MFCAECAEVVEQIDVVSKIKSSYKYTYEVSSKFDGYTWGLLCIIKNW